MYTSALHYIGFTNGNSYRIYFPESGAIQVSRDVSVDETVIGGASEAPSSSESTEFIEVDTSLPMPDVGSTSMPDVGSTNTVSTGAAAEELLSTDVSESIDEEKEDATLADQKTFSDGLTLEQLDSLTYDPGLRRSSRAPHPPERYGFEEKVLCCVIYQCHTIKQSSLKHMTSGSKL